MTEIRSFRACDALPVAALFQRTFHGREGAPPPAVVRAFEESFLQHPWYDPAMPSRVSVAADGSIRGFIGVYPVQMVFDGRPIRAAVASSLMMQGPEATALSGARLVRSFLGGPQDLSLSETANAISVAMWESLGARTLGVYSLDWLRILRPAGAAATFLGRRFSPGKVIAPLSTLVDRLLAKTSIYDGVLARVEASADATGREVTDDEFAEAAVASLQGRRLRPAWDPEVLPWLLRQAGRKDLYGTMFRRVVRDGAGRFLGAYVVHARSGRIARVLQVLATKRTAGPVLDDLFTFVRSLGGVAVQGRSEPLLLNALFARRCVFVHRGATTAHSRDPELLAAVEQGALITGLAGETWSPLIGNHYDDGGVSKPQKPARATAAPDGQSWPP